MYLPTLSVVISLVFLVRERESRFLEDHQVEEEVVFNLNSDSQQRTEELATFLTVNNDNLDPDMILVLSSLASSSLSSLSSSSSSSSSTSSAPAPMDASGMMTELQRLVRRKIAERMIQMRTSSGTTV